MYALKLAGRFGPKGLATKLVRKLTTPSCENDKIYELRLYKMKPEYFRSSLDLLQRYWPVRTAHSKDVGSWMTELGGICETVHLWEYDSLSDRMTKRQKVGEDSVWRNQFLPEFVKKAHKLTNVLLKPLPGTDVITTFPCSETAIYELLNSKPCAFKLQHIDDEIVVGKFRIIYGRAEGEFILYRYTDPDLALERAYQRRKDQNFQGSSRLLVPCQWSKLQ
ncbi:protein NipSnap homolog [Babylonia areolata]|uniref:protein NipSnap homolog n=1 Tax=Babylonia areolata TaxID=304850 RepID=UPI003FD0B544